jgi:hypothetical protein
MKMRSQDPPIVGKLYRNRGTKYYCDDTTVEFGECVLVLVYSETDSRTIADGFLAETTLLVTKLGIVSKGKYYSRDFEVIDWGYWWEEVE